MRIALEPWGSDYASQAIDGFEEDNSSVQASAEQVEEGPWEPKTPSLDFPPQEIAVVDGALRVDYFASVIEGEQYSPALFCSYAAGAAVLSEKVEITETQVHRLFIVGNNLSGQDIPIKAGNVSEVPILYKGISSSEQPRNVLMKKMRQTEAEVVEKLAGPEKLILADGNLTLIRSSSPVVGVIKDIQRLYLSPQKASILEELKPRQRTPLIQRQGYEVFTCFFRLSEPGPLQHILSGLVRLEIKTELGVSKASQILDQACVRIFGIASHAPKDPRAPQNLVPIGGLERKLRHKLGDLQIVRRGIMKAIRLIQQ